MITTVRVGGQIASNTTELYGITTDVPNLPTDGIPNASTFYDMQTQEVYMFDEENKVWILQ